jgi:hypothetical protein
MSVLLGVQDTTNIYIIENYKAKDKIVTLKKISGQMSQIWA